MPSHLLPLRKQALSPQVQRCDRQIMLTKITTIRLPAGFGASNRARSMRKRDGRTFGFTAFLAVWDWGLWRMLLSLILREFLRLVSFPDIEEMDSALGIWEESGQI